MKLLTTRLPADHNWFFGADLHYGSILFYLKRWNEFVKCIKSPYEGCSNNYAALGGDNIEAILINDKRADKQKMTEPFVRVQEREVTELIRPIAPELKYMLDGNHELTLWRYGDVVGEICRALNVPHGTVTTKMTVLNAKGKFMYKIFDTHGRKGINSSADDPLRRDVNHQLILKRHLRRKAGDCAVMIKHHTHKLFVTPPTRELYLTDDGDGLQQNYTEQDQKAKYIHPDMRWYGNAGSFMKLYEDGYSGYAEIAEYDPVELGFLVLIVRGGKIVQLKKHLLKGV